MDLIDALNRFILLFSNNQPKDISGKVLKLRSCYELPKWSKQPSELLGNFQNFHVFAPMLKILKYNSNLVIYNYAIIIIIKYNNFRPLARSCTSLVPLVNPFEL
jgi:hypothetical protein